MPLSASVLADTGSELTAPLFTQVASVLVPSTVCASTAGDDSKSSTNSSMPPERGQ